VFRQQAVTGENAIRGSDGARPLDRRRFLSVAGAATAAVLAGCSGLRRRSFEASPVVLSDGDQEAFRVAETDATSHTISRDGPAGAEVEITNHAAVYSRAGGLGGE
jgi:hypothetical protein